MQLLHGHGDLEVVTQNVESSEDVCPLDHLSQRTPLQHFGAEDISGLLRQEAHVDQDLKNRDTFGISTLNTTSNRRTNGEMVCVRVCSHRVGVQPVAAHRFQIDNKNLIEEI